MVWSISTDRMFRRCQRQWFFKTSYGNANCRKDPKRIEAYLLSKQSSLFAMRGSAVDDALTELLVPALNAGYIPDPKPIESLAQERLTAMLNSDGGVSLDERISKPGKLPEHFALRPLEAPPDAFDDDAVCRARDEMTQAVQNLFAMTEMLSTLASADRVMGQRALTWQTEGHSIRAVPDLLAFFNDEPPIVLDWKVHSFGNSDAAKQLASYALALNRVKRHRDFPPAAQDWPNEDIRLWEAQLLTNKLWKYEYCGAEYRELEQWISSHVGEVALSLHGRKKSSDFSPDDFSTAADGRICQRCNFKRLCWNKESAA